VSEKPPLNARQLKFCEEYVKTANGAASYHAAGYRCLGDSKAAGASAARLLADARVAAEVKRLRDKSSEKVAIAQADVLKMLLLLATADPSELCEHRIGACRHCYGKNGLYQFTPNEFDCAKASHEDGERKAAKKDPAYKPKPFSELGGVGFNPNRLPNPNCQECFGDGKSRPILKDTRNLSPGGKRLYTGFKYTSAGVEIKMADREAAIQLVGKHLGMFVDRHQDVGADLSALTNEELEMYAQIRSKIVEQESKR
jgi:phage terminase small subunit